MGAAMNYPKAETGSRADEIAGTLIKEYEQLYTLKGNWNWHYTEIAQRVVPMDSYLFMNIGQQAKGEKRNLELYDTTALVALDRFGAILDSLLTPRNSFWHQLRPEDNTLMKDKATREWFSKVNDILFHERYNPHANFAGQNQRVYKSLGAYGTGALFIDDLFGSPGLRYRNVHLSELYIQENHQGVVDRWCRHFRLTARQANLMFGEDNLTDVIKGALKNDPEKEFEFLHWVTPNTDRDPERKDYKGMKYSCYYIALDGRKLMMEKGYRTQPMPVTRWDQAPMEPYGRSPCMNCLPAIKTLNEMKKTMLKQGHRTVDPVLLVHDDGLIDGFSLEPGALNPGGVSSDGRALVQTLPVGNVQAGVEFMEAETKVINSQLLVDLFEIIIEKPDMTATEVSERAREKGILLNPTIGRQTSEYLGPMIDRELDVLQSQGRLPAMPRMLKQAKGQYKIVYDSPISRSQQAEYASGALRTIESLMTVAQATQNPGVMDYINWDIAAPAIADINGTPAGWINSQDAVDKIRQGRAQQQQVQTMIQAGPAAAAIMKAQQGQAS